MSIELDRREKRFDALWTKHAVDAGYIGVGVGICDKASCFALVNELMELDEHQLYEYKYQLVWENAPDWYMALHDSKEEHTYAATAKGFEELVGELLHQGFKVEDIKRRPAVRYAVVELSDTNEALQARFEPGLSTDLTTKNDVQNHVQNAK